MPYNIVLVSAVQKSESAICTHFNHSKMHMSVVLIIFTMPCNYHDHLPKQKLCNHQLSNFSSPQCLVIFNPLSASMNLPILDASCKWNHILLVLLCLGYFTQHNVFKAHSCYSLCQNFVPFVL